MTTSWNYVVHLVWKKIAANNRELGKQSGISAKADLSMAEIWGKIPAPISFYQELKKKYIYTD